MHEVNEVKNRAKCGQVKGLVIVRIPQPPSGKILSGSGTMEQLTSALRFEKGVGKRWTMCLPPNRKSL